MHYICKDTTSVSNELIDPYKLGPRLSKVRTNLFRDITSVARSVTRFLNISWSGRDGLDVV